MSRRRPDTPLPFSKAADLEGDTGQLAPYVAQVLACPDALNGQHDIRRWEYAMALRAIDAWDLRGEHQGGAPLEICDVGGGGSNFWQLLAQLTSEDIVLVDPNTGQPPPGQVQWIHSRLEEFAAISRHSRFDFLTCISVIEHIPDAALRPFFRACQMLLKPGGLLILTTDYWDAEGPDVAHFHWMRERIYNAERVRKLLVGLRELGFRSFGEADWSFHGPQCYDYSVASIVVTKK